MLLLPVSFIRYPTDLFWVNHGPGSQVQQIYVSPGEDSGHWSEREIMPQKKGKQKSGWPNKNPCLRRWLKAENGIYTDVRHELLLHAAPTFFSFSGGKGLYSIMQTQFSFPPVPSFLKGKILPPPSTA